MIPMTITAGTEDRNIRPAFCPRKPALSREQSNRRKRRELPWSLQATTFWAYGASTRSSGLEVLKRRPVGQPIDRAPVIVA